MDRSGCASRFRRGNWQVAQDIFLPLTRREPYHGKLCGGGLLILIYLVDDTSEASHDSQQSFADILSEQEESDIYITSFATSVDKPNQGPYELDCSSSVSSHRSRDSNWRPVDRPNPSYVQKMLKKIFHLKYHGSDAIPIKRVYNQLDWLGRGYLLRTDIERHLTQALSTTLLTISNDKLIWIINSCDNNHDGEHSIPDTNGFTALHWCCFTIFTLMFTTPAMLTAVSALRCCLRPGFVQTDHHPCENLPALVFWLANA